MTEKELQELSRQVARKLPVNPDWPWFSHEGDDWRNGQIVEDKGEGILCWFYQSTEACAEIEKRILNMEGFYPKCFKSEFDIGCVCWYDIGKEIRESINDHGGDLMQAWRVCTLRAVIIRPTK